MSGAAGIYVYIVLLCLFSVGLNLNLPSTAALHVLSCRLHGRRVATRAARLRAGLVGPDSIIALAIDAALDDLVGLARDVIAACADVASVRAS